MTKTYTRSALEHELEQLRSEILRMGSLVESAIERSVQALKTRDYDLAQQVVNDDDTINQLRYDMKSDAGLTLRTTRCERPGRRLRHAHCRRVEHRRSRRGHCRNCQRIFDEPLLKPLIDVPLMAQIAREMIHGALDAAIAHDVKAAEKVAARDDEIDALYQQIFRELLTYMLEDPRNISRATYLLWVAHNLERIGDRATNICERVIFMATGKLEEIKA
jgi:phosphate transport system protein